MSTPVKPATPNNRSSPTGTFFTPKPIGLTTTRKNTAKPLGTPGINATVNINGANSVKGPQQRLNFEAMKGGGKRKTQKRRKQQRKSHKHTTKSRA